MTSSRDASRQALTSAGELPHGRAQVARLQSLADGADRAGDLPLGTAVRIALIPACLAGGEHLRVPGLLSWLLERYDEAPSWFGPVEQRGVLACFASATVGLLQYPDLPLTQLETTLSVMAGRFAVAGESMAPVRHAEFLMALQVWGPDRAQRAFESWVAAQRSALSGCRQCERAEQVRQWAALGHHQVAVDRALPVLDGVWDSDCQAQPVGMIASVLGSLLEVGQAWRAACEHVRAVRFIRALPPGGVGCSVGDPTGWADQAGRAEQLLICARTGRLQRGLNLLESWLTWLTRVEPPAIRLQAAASAARLLRGLAEAGHGDLVLTGAGAVSERITVNDLGSRLAHEARELGARFNARNSTSTVGDLVEGILDAPSMPDLPLAPFTRSPRGARVAERRDEQLSGRRGVGRNAEFALALDDLPALAAAFDQALQGDQREQCTAILDAWQERRARPGAPVPGTSGAAEAQAAARLDGWLSLEQISRRGTPDQSGAGPQSALTASAQATERLRTSGLPIEAMLHEQAVLLAAAQAGRVDLGLATHRIEQLTIELGRTAGPGDAGLALSRLALIREVTAAAGRPTAVPPAELARVDPVDAGLAALDTVSPERLNHQQLRALCRLLRLRAGDEPPQQAIKTLFGAVAVLPDGIRPLERALAGMDLAAALRGGDPATALTAWEQAIVDAQRAGANALLSNLLAVCATLRLSLGDPAGAGTDLTRAVPLLDRYADPALAAQARMDLSRALLEVGHPEEAAEAAEAALADLTDLVQNLPEPPDRATADRHTGAAEVHLAGTAAYLAAEANAATGAIDRARDLAVGSADWHRRSGNLVAASEAWQLVGELGGAPEAVAADLALAAELAEAAGDWTRAANCRRERTLAVKEAEGLDAALAALDEADAVLDARLWSPAEQHLSEPEQRKVRAQVRWQRLALVEHRARMLAVAGRFQEAMAQVVGLSEEYRQIGDDWSARDLMGLRGQLRAELNDLDGALDDLRRAAEEAEVARDREQAHGLGERLAAVLDKAGRRVEAEAAWQRFAP